MPGKRWAFGICNVIGLIVVAGGLEGLQYDQSRTDVYDIVTNQWRQAPFLNSPKFSNALLAIQKRWVYSICGYSYAG